MVNERENDRVKKRTCRQCLSRGSVLEINMQALPFHDGAMPCESGGRLAKVICTQTTVAQCNDRENYKTNKGPSPN